MTLYLVIGIIFVMIVGLQWWDADCQVNDSMRKRARMAELADAAVNEYLVVLIAEPTNPAVQDLFWTRFGNLDTAYLPAEVSEAVYQEVLRQVERQPEATGLRTFALKIGRWQAGRRRPDGLPTVYDEQAIANDLTVRTASQQLELHR